MIKKLITSGCSFSDCKSKTWPIFLRGRIPGVKHYTEGVSSQGNDLIARRVHYRINELLKENQANDIFVAIMWTSKERFGFYYEDPGELSNTDGWVENPTRVADDSPGGWVILNPHWTHRYNSDWYKTYYNDIAAQIYTLEHIVNTQNFLKLYDVPYFMTSSFGNHINLHMATTNSNCRWLYDQIDWDKWLPVDSEKSWVEQNCPIPGLNNFHPRPEQHKNFTDQVIVPWLESRNYLTTT